MLIFVSNPMHKLGFSDLMFGPRVLALSCKLHSLSTKQYVMLTFAAVSGSPVCLDASAAFLQIVHSGNARFYGEAPGKAESKWMRVVQSIS